MRRRSSSVAARANAFSRTGIRSSRLTDSATAARVTGTESQVDDIESRPLFLLELELAEVHNPAYRGACQGSHLDQIEVEIPGDRQGLEKGLDAEVRTIGVYKQDFTSADLFVDPVLSCLFDDASS